VANRKLTKLQGQNLPSSQSFGTFLGLEGRPNGNVHFQFVGAAANQVPITSADIDAVFVLVFGTRGPAWPSFTNGKFDPPWLAHTDIGNTFHSTDQLLSRLSGLVNMPLSDEPGASRKELVVGFHEADQEIKTCQDAHAHRHLVRPEKIYRTWSELPDGTLRCQMHKVQMRVEPRQDQPLDKHRPSFDPTKQGLFDHLAARWPVLERYRQLMGLLYAIHELRERGFCPGHILANSIRANEVAFAEGKYAPADPEFITASS
jgi:hypothetical protein